MMLNKFSSVGSSSTIVALVGGHSIASALLHGNNGQAIIEALTICICISILWLPEWLKGRYDANKRRSEIQMRARQRKVVRLSENSKKTSRRRTGRASTKSLK